MGYFTGMRQGEILPLRWEQVSLTDSQVLLDPGITKNDEPRPVSTGFGHSLGIEPIFNGKTGSEEKAKSFTGKEKIWLGGLDSNQDSQIQSLESYQLDDLPAETQNLDHGTACSSSQKGQSQQFCLRSMAKSSTHACSSCMKLGRLRERNFEEHQTWAMVSMANY